MAPGTPKKSDQDRLDAAICLIVALQWRRGPRDRVAVDVEPNLAYEAAEENRRRAGENVVAVLGAKIDSQGVRIEAEIKAQTARIDVLQRVIWP